MALKLTRPYSVGLDVRRRLYLGGDIPLTLLRVDEGDPATVQLVQIERGWRAFQRGDRWVVEIAESDEVLESQIARAQRLRWLDLEVEVHERAEPPHRAKRIWTLTCAVVRRTEEQL